MQNTTHPATPAAQINDLQIELEDILSLSGHLGGDEALSSVSVLLDDYNHGESDEWLSLNAAADTMRFYSNTLLLHNRIQQIFNQFCGKEASHE